MKINELNEKQIHDLEIFLNEIIDDNSLLNIDQAIGVVKAAYKHWEKYIDSF